MQDLTQPRRLAYAHLETCQHNFSLMASRRPPHLLPDFLVINRGEGTGLEWLTSKAESMAFFHVAEQGSNHPQSTTDLPDHA